MNNSFRDLGKITNEQSWKVSLGKKKKKAMKFNVLRKYLSCFSGPPGKPVTFSYLSAEGQSGTVLADKVQESDVS